MIKTIYDTLVNPCDANGRSLRRSDNLRVGKIALGRLLTMLLRLLIIKPLTIEEAKATINAVYVYMVTSDVSPDGYVDSEIFDMLKAEIDKSAARSLKARERAALRKARREAAQADVEATAPAPAPAMETVEMPEPVVVPKPRPRREPDTIVSNYRPKKKTLPRYRVLTDEEMNAEPYDPFGAHRAYEIRLGRRRW